MSPSPGSAAPPSRPAPRVLVEVTGSLGEGRVRDFLEAAYRVGMREPLGLVIPWSFRAGVNRRLDPVVAYYGIRGSGGLHPGVRFLDPRDREVLEVARSAGVVVATSTPFQRRLSHSGVPWVGTSEGLRVLEALGGRAEGHPGFMEDGNGIRPGRGRGTGLPAPPVSPRFAGLQSKRRLSRRTQPSGNGTAPAQRSP